MVLGYGLQGEAMQRHLQQAKEMLGSGLAALDVRATSEPPAEAVHREAERQPYDLVIMGFNKANGLDLAEASCRLASTTCCWCRVRRRCPRAR